MSEIFKLKFKMHRFVNYIFYLGIFLIGFIFGLTLNSAKAYTINNYSDKVSLSDFTRPTSNTWYKEDFIYSTFEKIVELTGLDVSFEQYKHVIAYQYTSSSWKDKYYSFIFSTTEPTGSISNNYLTGDSISLNLNYSSNIISLTQSVGRNNELLLKNRITSEYATTVNSFSASHYLDFSEYLNPIKYNDNLFENNSNFKQVCVEPNKSYAITRTTTPELNSSFDYDYIWFKHGIYGLSYGLYDSTVDGKFTSYDDESYNRYWFNSKDYINSLDSGTVTEFKLKGYEPLKDYFDYTAYPFRLYFNTDDNTQQFTIFNINSPTSLFISDSGNIHGGGGLRIPFDEEIEVSDEKYCFYIKNEYTVTEVLIDEWGDYIGTVPTPNGDLDFNTSYNKNNVDSGSLFNSIYVFIDNIYTTVISINTTIYNFYSSLPLLLRLFVITFLILLIIKFIIEVIKK